jgi:hypothetical protein
VQPGEGTPTNSTPRSWWARLQDAFRKPVPDAGWGRFWLGAAILVILRLVPAGRHQRDPFLQWTEVAVFLGIVAILALFHYIEPSKAAASESEHWTRGGIEVWLPLTLLAIFIIGGILLGIATAR